jgi:hypothetical protein
MKKYILILPFILSLSVFTTSCKKDKSETMTVVRNCTGTYLRLDGKDYHVCNLEMVEPFSDGESVSVEFKKIKECHGSANEVIICQMVYENEGWIEVESIE